MVWYFIGVYIINRTLHGRLETRNFSTRVEKIFFQRSKRNFVSPSGHVISSISTASNLHHHLLAVFVVKFWKLLHRPFPKTLVAINLTLQDVYGLRLIICFLNTAAKDISPIEVLFRYSRLQVTGISSTPGLYDHVTNVDLALTSLGLT